MENEKQTKNILTYIKQSRHKIITLITLLENYGLKKENKSN